MSETDMRATVVEALKPLDAFAVENPCRPGTPDVNYVEGWIELKWLRDWPKGADTVVALDHFTPQQRVFLRRRWRAGGNAYLLLQCKKEWLLFSGEAASLVVGNATRAGLLAHALFSWDSKSAMSQELRNWLIRRPIP